eukprot:gene6111-10118_t
MCWRLRKIILNIINSEIKTVFEGVKEYSQCLSFDDMFMAIGSSAVVLDENGKLITEFSTFEDHFIRSHCTFSDGSLVLAGSNLEHIERYDLNDLRAGKVQTLQKLDSMDNVDWIYNIMNINEQYIGYFKHKKFRVRNYKTFKLEKSIAFEYPTNLSSYYDKSTGYLYLGFYNGLMVVIEDKTWIIIEKLNLNESLSCIRPISNRYLAISTYEGNIFVLEKNTLVCIQNIKAENYEFESNEKINESHFSDHYYSDTDSQKGYGRDILNLTILSHSTLVSCCENGTITFWDIHNLEQDKIFWMLIYQKEIDTKFNFI